MPTPVGMKSDTRWVGPRPSRSGPSCQIAAMATAGTGRPMWAMWPGAVGEVREGLGWGRAPATVRHPSARRFVSSDAQVAHVGKARCPHMALGTGQGCVDLDESDGLPVHVRGEARTAFPQRALDPDAGSGLGQGQVGDRGKEQHFRVPGVTEARAFVDGARMCGQGRGSPSSAGAGSAPRRRSRGRSSGPAEPGRRSSSWSAGLLRVGEERRRRLVDEPVDLTRVPVALADLGVGAGGADGPLRPRTCAARRRGCPARSPSGR